MVTLRFSRAWVHNPEIVYIADPSDSRLSTGRSGSGHGSAHRRRDRRSRSAPPVSVGQSWAGAPAVAFSSGRPDVLDSIDDDGLFRGISAPITSAADAEVKAPEGSCGRDSGATGAVVPGASSSAKAASASAAPSYSASTCTSQPAGTRSRYAGHVRVGEEGHQATWRRPASRSLRAVELENWRRRIGESRRAGPRREDRRRVATASGMSHTTSGRRLPRRSARPRPGLARGWRPHRSASSWVLPSAAPPARRPPASRRRASAGGGGAAGRPYLGPRCTSAGRINVEICEPERLAAMASAVSGPTAALSTRRRPQPAPGPGSASMSDSSGASYFL